MDQIRSGFTCKCCDFTFPDALSFSTHIHENDPPRVQLAEQLEEMSTLEDQVVEEAVSRSGMESDWRTIKYVCTDRRCGATTHERIFGDHPPTPMLNCWKCHAGQGISMQDQLVQNKGMKPLLDTPELVQ